LGAVKDVVKKTMQEYNKNPDGNAISSGQMQTIERAWKIVTGEEKSFAEIAVQFRGSA
jgi:hypothetical protein